MNADTLAKMKEKAKRHAARGGWSPIVLYAKDVVELIETVEKLGTEKHNV